MGAARRALYLPKEWTEDADRWKAAGVPADVRFATKIVLARRMVERALKAGVPAAWATGDVVYGSDYGFLKAVEDRRLGYVLGVRTDQSVCVSFRQACVRALLAEVPSQAWRRLSCGDGSKGLRLYDWAAVAVNCPEAYGRWLLIRRSTADPTEVAYFLYGGPSRTALAEGAAGLIPLTAPEARRLRLRFVWDRLHAEENVLAWSRWRRAHQFRARACHYRSRGTRPPT